MGERVCRYQKLPFMKFIHTTAKLQISVSIPGYMNCFHFCTFVKGKKSTALFTLHIPNGTLTGMNTSYVY
jgi:hypothetical protein